MTDFRSILSDSIAGGTFLAATLSKPRKAAAPAVQRVSVRPTLVAGQPRFQFASRTEGRETHENLPAGEAVQRIADLFGTAFEHCHLFTAEADYAARAAPGGATKVKRQPPSRQPVPAAEHNRTKQYLIPENVPCPFLAEIGVMTPEGKVRAAKYHKFRQINRFLELVDDVYSELPASGPLHVVDFGCGKSYLTFALHHLLANVHGREVRIVGLDRKTDVIRDCRRIADRLGCRGLEFRVGDITGHAAEQQVHLAVALHACDTATDDALTKAAGWQADVILAVPCCQHELAAKLPASVLPPLMEHGILRERFAALATDALRAKALETRGYRTQVLEFIDLEHTAKNILIRAVRREAARDVSQRREEYRQLKQSLGLNSIAPDTILCPGCE